MQKIFTELPMPYLSIADAMQYLKDSPYLETSPHRLKEDMYEFMFTAKPLLQPRGMIVSFPVVNNQIDFGDWKYSVLPGVLRYQKISFMVAALSNQLESYIEDLAQKNTDQAAMLDALAWEGLMVSSNSLFEAVLQESLDSNLQVTKSLPWLEDFIELSLEKISVSMNTKKLEITCNSPRYTFWGAVGWIL